MSSFPSAAARLCLGCITQAGMGMVKHRLHPGLGQMNPVRELASLPFPKIPAGTPFPGKPVSPEASSHSSLWHTAPALCPGKHPAPETALACSPTNCSWMLSFWREKTHQELPYGCQGGSSYFHTEQAQMLL